jgi:hypothetical protein
VSNGDSFAASLDRLFDSERQARAVHDELAGRGRRGELDAFVDAADKLIAEAPSLDPDEASLRLVCLARLLGEFEGAQVADTLIDVLGCESPEGRHEAGEQLQGLAFDRFKEVATATERALERYPDGSSALMELPYLLVEIPEGGVMKLLGLFLQHRHADAVAAAIEAFAEIGDPAAVKLLAPLTGDKRMASVGDEDESQAEVTVGELATEAIELLRAAEDPLEEG